MTVERTRSRLILVMVALAQVMVVLDDTVVNVALPSINQALGFGGADLAWVVDAYMLLFGGFMILAGRLADRVGRLRVFLGGLALFTLASLAAGLSQTAVALVLARGVQGLGAALLYTSSLAILVSTFTEPAPRRMAMAVWAGVQAISGILGVLAGGVITQWFGWRWVFFVNIPVGLVLALAVRAARLPRHRTAIHSDVLGTLIPTAGLVVLVWTVLGTSHRGWMQPATLGGAGAAAVLLAVFAARERRSAEPIIDRSLLARPGFVLALTMIALLMGALFSAFFFLTQYFQNVEGLSPLATAVRWIPWSVALVTAAGASTRLLRRLSVRPLLVVGSCLASAGFLLLTRIQAHGSYAGDVVPAFVTLGLGMGLAMVPLSVAAMGGVAAEGSGVASGVVGAMQQVGGAVGLAALASVAAARARDAFVTTGNLAGAMVTGFHVAFVVAAGLVAVAALVALRLLPSSTPG